MGWVCKEWQHEVIFLSGDKDCQSQDGKPDAILAILNQPCRFFQAMLELNRWCRKHAAGEIVATLSINEMAHWPCQEAQVVVSSGVIKNKKRKNRDIIKALAINNTLAISTVAGFCTSTVSTGFFRCCQSIQIRKPRRQNADFPESYTQTTTKCLSIGWLRRIN